MKWLVVVLLAINGVVWAWWTGQLTPLWDPPGTGEREPFRAQRQLRPDLVQLVPARPGAAGLGGVGATPSAPAASSAGTTASASPGR